MSKPVRNMQRADHQQVRPIEVLIREFQLQLIHTTASKGNS